ncbi:tRNA (adenosine(37)-N6)-threonylcarbamoyltransferase complex ATPase subunit type 1 TsaE [Cytobacillus purgationiresistens]|uniref:tRNA threonylcarbamoyladenosine biosynthesis protein TsaE n=1 Tax=Cytobacillus purgationiresistens TaxID=863449 RepID=A0ABU0AV50_9BACI|nr:tRNA (adenosine(37)-N6)-threonylcarbamoyltransferase complex ATPase subunit type 1 TsaE [Cytobacillus purgationiresistens]MDQ0273860.1 tRNA threonylcarbamoyladenosine biosynthesis protein TsaE [Cytobacillus purgationiresistens]
MSNLEFIFISPEETMAFSKRLGELMEPGCVIVLEGDLGAGKTTFTKGLALGLDISKTVNSPTFTIIKEYKGRIPLYHMDVYRVEDSFEDLGFDEYFEGEGVTIVEWAHLIEEQLPDERLEVFIYHKSENERRIQLEPKGERYVSICKELLK